MDNRPKFTYAVRFEQDSDAWDIIIAANAGEAKKIIADRDGFSMNQLRAKRI